MRCKACWGRCICPKMHNYILSANMVGKGRLTTLSEQRYKTPFICADIMSTELRIVLFDQSVGGTRDVNFQNAAMAEAAAICATLVTCIKKGLDCIEIESNAKTIIQMVNK